MLETVHIVLLNPTWKVQSPGLGAWPPHDLTQSWLVFNLQKVQECHHVCLFLGPFLSYLLKHNQLLLSILGVQSLVWIWWLRPLLMASMPTSAWVSSSSSGLFFPVYVSSGPAVWAKSSSNFGSFRSSLNGPMWSSLAAGSVVLMLRQGSVGENNHKSTKASLLKNGGSQNTIQ